MLPIPHALQATSLALAVAALIAAACHDIRSYEIPDRYALTIGGGFVVASLAGTPGEALLGLAFGAAMLIAGALLFARGWLGGGDVKLLAAVALWVPASFLASFALITSLAGAALGLVFLSPLRRLLPAPPAALATAGEGGAAALRQPMPFGVAVAVGGLFALLARVTA